MDSKAGEAQIDILGGGRIATEGKIGGPIGDLGRLSVGDFVDVDTRRIEEATMEELNFERQRFAVPQGALGQKANLPVVVVVEVFKIVG